PRDHGITLNDMFFRSTGTVVNCVQDDAVRPVGPAGRRSARSPVNLLAGTIADEMERRWDGRSKTIGVAVKDRGAILPMGRTGDAAYWFVDEPDGRFATSSWYMDSLPAWLMEFNAAGHFHRHMRGTWDLLLPRERYHQALPDDNPYEHPVPGAPSATLPLDIAAAFAASDNDLYLFKLLPAALTMTTDLAIAAMKGEDMGRDEVPDLLAVSYSATDEIGHAMGPRSLEVQDMYLRLDRELERLLKELDAHVGRGHYTVFLTADHAGGDVPEYLKDRKASAGYVDVSEVTATVEAALQQRFGPGPWVRKRMKEQLFLNDSLMAARGVDRTAMQRATADAVRAVPGVAAAYTATEIAGPAMPERRAAMVQRAFMPERCGDVYYVLRPGHGQTAPGYARKGMDHGSPWNYDTHVPVIFYGKGVRPGEVLRRTAITDVAPTVCAIIGMALPDAAIGDPVPEAIAR
ncbi:MAG: alkaline phosphatase family protein, partial [Flavobacteriales bacterium]|nr:alkaline phosphatase family protein [Flavobacteriales bacterium]